MVYKINEEDCVACGTCQGECPNGAILEGDVYRIDPDARADRKPERFRGGGSDALRGRAAEA